MTKVNMDKWTEINYDQIREGDVVRVVTQNGNVTIDVRGEVNFVGYSGVLSESNVLIALSEDRFKAAEARMLTRKIYRRKPQPFEFPEELFSVISGVRGGAEKRFVRSDGGWVGGNVVRYGEGVIRDHYTHLTLLRKGL